jgi:GAF domain-containing protein
MLHHRTPVIDRPASITMLQHHDLPDTQVAPTFDRLTQLASRLLRAAVALVALRNEDGHCFTSLAGLAKLLPAADHLPLVHAIGQHTLALGRLLIIPDTRTHLLLKESTAMRDLGIVAYAGIPLLAPDGQVLGVFCAIDTAPRAWRAEQIAILEDLAAAVTTEIALRSEISQRRQSQEAHERLIQELSRTPANAKALKRLLPICAGCKNIRDDQGGWNKLESYFRTYADLDFTHGICPECARRLYGD